MRSLYLWKLTRLGLKKWETKRKVCTKISQIILLFELQACKLWPKNTRSAFFPFLTCHSWHIRQQKCLKSTDFTIRPTNLCVQIKWCCSKVIFSSPNLILTPLELLSKYTSTTFNILAFFFISKKMLTQNDPNVLMSENLVYTHFPADAERHTLFGTEQVFWVSLIFLSRSCQPYLRCNLHISVQSFFFLFKLSACLNHLLLHKRLFKSTEVVGDVLHLALEKRWASFRTKPAEFLRQFP